MPRGSDLLWILQSYMCQSTVTCTTQPKLNSTMWFLNSNATNLTTCNLVHTQSTCTYKNAPNLRKRNHYSTTLCCCWHISSGNSCALENKLHTTLSELAVVGTKVLNKPCLNRCSANTASNGVEQVWEATLCTMRSPKSAIWIQFWADICRK